MFSTEKFKSPSIYELEQELIRARKQLSNKQNQWKQEKILLVQKNQLTLLQLNQMKETSANLKKVNETLTMAQLERKFESPLSDLNHFKDNNDKKTEKQIRYQLESQYRLKEMKIKQQFDDELEDELQKQQKMLRKKFHSQMSKLQSQNQFLRTRAQQLQSQVNFSHSQINQLRDQLSIATNSITSFRSSTSDKFLNFINNSKQTSSHHDLLNTSCTSNVVSQMLCEVCSQVFTTNDFFEHAQQCSRECQQDYQDLLSRKRQIQQQLQMLNYDTKPNKKSNKIIMIINQHKKTKKQKQKQRQRERERERQKERSFIKSYKNSPSNSFIQSNLKSSLKNRY